MRTGNTTFFFPLYKRCKACGEYVTRSKMFLALNGDAFCTLQAAANYKHYRVWQWHEPSKSAVLFTMTREVIVNQDGTLYANVPPKIGPMQWVVVEL